MDLLDVRLSGSGEPLRSTLVVAIAHRIGTIRSSLSGDGVVMPEEKWTPEAGIETPDVSLSEKTVVMGWVLSFILDIRSRS